MNNENVPKKDNPYADYLPENRIKRETGMSLEKTQHFSKMYLGFFWGFFVILLVVIGFWFNGNILKNKVRAFNMNLTESINLDKIYDSEDVEWVSNSNNVIVENNVITAVKSGKAYIYATKDNKIVTDATINILTGEEAFNLEQHSMTARVGENTNIKVSKNITYEQEEDNSKSPKEVVVEFLKSIYYRFFPNQEKEDLEKVQNVGNDDSNNGIDNFNQDIPLNNNGNISNETNSNGIIINDTDDLDNELDDMDEFDAEFDDNFSNEEGMNLDVENDNSYVSKYTYISTDEDVATVDENGNIDIISEGIAEIIVQDENGNKDSAFVTGVDDSIVLYNSEYLLNVGDVIDIEYSLNSENYNISDIKWQSENESVATVEEPGKIHAFEVGETNVIVSVGNISKTIIVKVVAEEVDLPTDLTLSDTDISIMVGESRTISSFVSQGNNDVNWVSDDESVAFVKNGVIVGKGEGKTNVSVTTVNGIKKEVLVNVIQKEVPVEGITFGGSNMNMKVGESEKLKYALYPAGATNKNILISYDRSILRIDSNYMVTALKSGTTTITLESENHKSASMNVTIEDVLLEKIQMNTSSLNLKVGDSDDLSVIFSPSNATNKNIIWTSSDNNVATVENGHVVGMSVGTAVITATSQMNNSLITTSNVTVTSEKTYTVIFNGNGSTSGKVGNKICIYNANCQLPKNEYVKTGYTFDGWSTTEAGDKVYSDADVVSKLTSNDSITLYAHWSKNQNNISKEKITVSFDCNGGTGGGNQIFTEGTSNQKFSKTCKRNGYTLMGWKKDKDGTSVIYSVTSGVKDSWIIANSPSITLYAHWEAIQAQNINTSVDVTFNCNGGVGGGNQIFTTNGGSQKFSTVCTKLGYTLAGWKKRSTDEKANYEVNSPVSKDWIERNSPSVTLYAHWTPKIISVTFDCNGGTGGGMQKFTYGVGNQNFDKTCTRNGYLLAGWSKKINNGERTYRVKSGVSDNWIDGNSPSITLYAVWAKNYGDPLVSFLPTSPSEPGSNSDESILLRSQDGTLALIDTGYNWGKTNAEYKGICGKLTQYIHKYAKVSLNKVAVLDYLILSHSHSDHVGCLSTLLNDKTLRIKNIITKEEGLSPAHYHLVTKYTNAHQDYSNLIKTNNLSENYELTLGMVGTKQIKLHLFNLKDVYADNCKTIHDFVSVDFLYFSSYSNLIKNEKVIKNNKGQYLYLPTANSRTIQKVSSTDTKALEKLVGKRAGDKSGAHLNLFAVAGDKRSSRLCNANANSIVVLAEFLGSRDANTRYVYLPSDLQNNGYTFIGEKYGNVTLTSNISHYYKIDKNGNHVFDKNGNFILDSNLQIKKPQEYLTAVAVKNFIGAGNLNKITVYQATHHGYNNDKASVNMLNLNRNNIYVISLKGGLQGNIRNGQNQRSYYYSMDKVNKNTFNKTTFGFYYTGAFFEEKGTSKVIQFSFDGNGKTSMSTTLK